METPHQSWVIKAGYGGVRSAQRWLVFLGGAPFLWLFVQMDFRSAQYEWAFRGAGVAITIATILGAYRMRCAACRMPVYAFWLIGLPSRKQSFQFEGLSECPYCSDDGSGQVGDPGAVNANHELRRANIRVVKAVLAFLAFCGLCVAFVFFRERGLAPPE